LFYIGIPLALPAVADAARRKAGGALFWVLTAFLVFSGLSALWSGRPLTVGDELRRAFWIEYLLLIFVAIGANGIPLLRRVLQAMLVFVALAATVIVVNFFIHCTECGRFAGFGPHAKATYTAMITGALALIGLSAVFSNPGAPSLALLACQAPLCALLLATGSRGAVPSYIAGLLLSAAMVVRRSGRRHAWLAIATVLGCIGVVLAAVAVLGRGWLATQIARGDSERFTLWAANLDRIAQRPWFGHGATAWDKVALDNGEIGTHAHNLFLAQGYYGGIVGFGLWAATFVLALRVGIRVFRARGELLPLVPIVFTMLVGAVDIGPVVVDTQPEWLYVWVVLGIALAYDIDLRRRAIVSR
jgi:O-antigen ligase